MIEQAKFMSECYEKRPYLFRQEESLPTVTWADVDNALYVGEQGASGILIHKGGSFVPENEYSEVCIDIERRRRAIKKDKFTELVSSGASIIFNRMESVSPPIRSICQQLARVVKADTCANGYISFGGEQAFGNHWDTHDVFAVQLQGRKRWTLYEPTFDLPLKEQRSGAYKEQCPTRPVMEVVLEAGDILYVPRGWWHSAEALPGEPTFHIAVGVHPIVVLDYVKWLTSEVFSESEVFRRSLVSGDGKKNLQELGQAVGNMFKDEVTFNKYLTSRSENARWFSHYGMELRFVRPTEELQDNLRLAANWSELSEDIARRVKQATGQLADVAINLVKRVSSEPAGTHFAQLIEQFDGYERGDVEKIVWSLIRHDVLSIVAH